MQNNDMPSRRSDSYKPKQFLWIRSKSLLRSKLSKYPTIETPAIKFWRAAKFSFWKYKWKLEALLGSWRGTHVRNMDVDKICWVSPQKIVFSALQEFNSHDFKGHILGGDWDKLEKRFDTLDIYIAIKQVCVEGKKWADTLFYQHILDDLNEGHIHYNCQDERDLDQRCHYIESLFNNIRLIGYKSQQELFIAGHIQDPLVAEEEISLSIGRFGDLLFSDGAHRLAIAKLLGVPIIPVKIIVRHKDWIKFRNELLFYARDDTVTKNGKFYQPLIHPDLTDLPAAHECEDRFQLIKDNSSIRQGRLLDIGANLGYFCHRFEERGLDCYAAENHPPTVYFLKRLARAENRRFKIITESVLDSQVIRNTHFNIVLALNIFHHFLKTQQDYDKFVDLLHKLQMDELFFESHLADELQMQAAYKNYSPDEFVKFIIRNSNLKHADLISTMKDGRPLYRLY
jgi:hypothetical protein